MPNQTSVAVPAQVSERLAEEFTGQLSAAAIDTIVHAAARDLEGQIVPEALDEMLHRLARFRLVRLVDATRGTQNRLPSSSGQPQTA
ncbi:hypothetical protein [Amycolatopsis sp. NPDC050768]|uniref:hypothetical protein n=1 Tax=Amycolatopsis sp. NPDC050768 TaxID=3154839 RepID=UPI0033C75FDC